MAGVVGYVASRYFSSPFPPLPENWGTFGGIFQAGYRLSKGGHSDIPAIFPPLSPSRLWGCLGCGVLAWRWELSHGWVSLVLALTVPISVIQIGVSPSGPTGVLNKRTQND